MSLFDVPASTPSFPCRSCGKRCHWIRTAKGIPMLVDTDVEGGRAPTAREPGLGQSHFATCPDADKMRKRRQAG